mgnify:CR=1 FL=1|jgi:hypothetical protein
MPKIVVGGINMINHLYWENYYGTSTSYPTTISGDFTRYNNISKTSKTSSSQNYRPDNENIKNTNSDNTKQHLQKICKLTIDRPSLRYYFNDLEPEKAVGLQSSFILKPITNSESEKIIELPIPDELLKKHPNYTTEEIISKAKKNKSEDKFKFNLKFKEKDDYTKKYNRHFPLVMADSVYIPEINTRFELNRKTNWYEPTLKYIFTD